MRRFSKGFSLVELMVVVAIIGIGASLAVPKFQNQMQIERTRETAENFNVALVKAQNNAQKTGRLQFVVLQIGSAKISEFAVYEDSNNNGNFDSSDTMEFKYEVNTDLVRLGLKGLQNNNQAYKFIKKIDNFCSHCSIGQTILAIAPNMQIYTVNDNSLNAIDYFYINFAPSYEYNIDNADFVRMVLITSTGGVKTIKRTN